MRDNHTIHHQHELDRQRNNWERDCKPSKGIELVQLRDLQLDLDIQSTHSSRRSHYETHRSIHSNHRHPNHRQLCYMRDNHTIRRRYESDRQRNNQPKKGIELVQLRDLQLDLDIQSTHSSRNSPYVTHRSIHSNLRHPNHRMRCYMRDNHTIHHQHELDRQRNNWEGEYRDCHQGG
jgi:hypothetical protein